MEQNGLAQKELNAPVDRVAFTLTEFAALFGKKRLWAYRQMWAHRVKVIEVFGGSPMVPVSEIKRLQRKAHFFNGNVA